MTSRQRAPGRPRCAVHRLPRCPSAVSVQGVDASRVAVLSSLAVLGQLRSSLIVARSGVASRVIRLEGRHPLVRLVVASLVSSVGLQSSLMRHLAGL